MFLMVLERIVNCLKQGGIKKVFSLLAKTQLAYANGSQQTHLRSFAKIAQLSLLTAEALGQNASQLNVATFNAPIEITRFQSGSEKP